MRETYETDPLDEPPMPNGRTTQPRCAAVPVPGRAAGPVQGSWRRYAPARAAASAAAAARSAAGSSSGSAVVSIR
ncbi:hypothetical protein KAURM247S_02283 [Kitasatospora aureofaciens]